MGDSNEFSVETELIDVTGKTLEKFKGAFPAVVGSRIDLDGGYSGDDEGGIPPSTEPTRFYVVIRPPDTKVYVPQGIFAVPKIKTIITVRKL